MTQHLKLPQQDNVKQKRGGAKHMERQLTLELARFTEAAALAASHSVGRGMKNVSDDAATTVMRYEFRYIPIDGTVVIG